VDAWAARSDDTHVDLLSGNHAFPRQDIAPQAVTWHIRSSRKPKGARVQYVDDDHCNSRQAWVDMGSPDYLDVKQVAELDEVSQLQSEPVAIQPHDDGFDIRLNLLPHGIAAVRVELSN